MPDRGGAARQRATAPLAPFNARANCRAASRPSPTRRAATPACKPEHRIARAGPERPPRPGEARARTARSGERPAERVGGADARLPAPDAAAEPHRAGGAAVVRLEQHGLGVGQPAARAVARELSARGREVAPRGARDVRRPARAPRGRRARAPGGRFGGEAAQARGGPTQVAARRVHARESLRARPSSRERSGAKPCRRRAPLRGGLARARDCRSAPARRRGSRARHPRRRRIASRARRRPGHR